MTETAEPTTLSVDDRTSARGFFDVGAGGDQVFPPPQLASTTVPVPATAPAIGVPQLPRVLPSIPIPTSATPFAFSPESIGGAPAKARSVQKKRSGGGARRSFSWLLVLAIIGGGIYAGFKYGPALLHRDESDPTAGEPAAPLAFPPVVATATPVRTANFQVEHPVGDGTIARYEVTSDFETGVSRMLIDRATMPDIEVLAVFDIANLRRMDQSNWWSIPRGDFPLGPASERQQWLRTVDDYFPAAMRPFITIDNASEAVLGSEPVRHLVVTVDGGAIARLGTDPMTGQPIPPQTTGEFVLPESMLASPETIEPLTIEMWVDSNGLIRKLVEPASMGGATVTVNSLSPDAFNPTFPAPEVVTPLTAEQLIDLAL